MISGESVAVMAFDKFPDHRHVIQAVGMEPWGFSELMVIDPTTAELLASKVTGCSGRPENYTQFSHEARVRPNHGDVITVKEYVKKVKDIPSANGATSVKVEGYGDVEYVFNDIIGAWKPDVDDDSADDDANNGDWTDMYHMLAYFDPISDSVDAVNSFTETQAMCGQNDGKVSVLDWSHVSAISFASVQGVYIISLRNLDTVAAIDATTGDLKWKLSSQVDDVGSDFAWSADDDKFYNVHSAYLVEETDFADDWGSNATSNKLRLMLFDGGNNRPKCHMNNTGCFSRACEYHLDTLAGTATLAWQVHTSPRAPRRRGRRGWNSGPLPLAVRVPVRGRRLGELAHAAPRRHVRERRRERGALLERRGGPQALLRRVHDELQRRERGRQGVRLHGRRPRQRADRDLGAPALLERRRRGHVPRAPVQVHLRRGRGLPVLDDAPDDAELGPRAARAPAAPLPPFPPRFSMSI